MKAGMPQDQGQKMGHISRDERDRRMEIVAQRRETRIQRHTRREGIRGKEEA